jgi:hypothetical protein
MIGPSLSVVHTLPSRRKKLAPALSSPPKQYEPSNNPDVDVGEHEIFLKRRCRFDRDLERHPLHTGIAVSQ